MPIVNFMMIHLIVGQIKKIPLNKMSYYPELDIGTNKKNLNQICPSIKQNLK